MLRSESIMKGSPRSRRLADCLLQLAILAAFCSRALADVYEPDVDKVVTLFEKDDNLGNSTTIYWHQAQLDEDWASVNQKGIWIYYSEANYKGDNVTVVFGEDLSINIRHQLVGDEDDLVLIPNFRDMGTSAQSLVIVGADWTFFPKQNFGGSRCLCLRPTFFTMTEDDDGEDVMLKASFYPELSEVGPVGSVMMSCKTPMRHLCQKLPEETVRRSRCPVLSNTEPNMCQ
ncbi:uncharacterized protein LOC125035475 isoform X3 [Penaeus chinensis]|uniref:uncharacterized protein LOC125035475 isoform X3 n=1 Tax=Penaeus chinensis TaxID=139456 RepID=UPI001FB7DBBB|nr:uncharacterized protein LOC125035475 isoform X3 [Penaeus chinensis]